MDILPSSVEGAITFWGGILVALGGVVVKAAKTWRAAQDKRMRSIPPTALPHALERRLDTVERVLAAQAEWDAAELRRELAEALKALVEARQDAYQAQQALAAERLSKQRLRKELDRLRGHR